MTETVETGRTGLMDAVDSNGRTIRVGDLVRYDATGVRHDVEQLCPDSLPAYRTIRGRAYRPVFLSGRGWVCPHLVTIEVSRREAAA